MQSSDAVFTPPEIDEVDAPADGWFESGCTLPLEILRRIRRGYKPGRSPDLVVVPREPNFFGGYTSTTHSGPWDYLQEVPLVFYGPGFIKDQGDVTVRREVTLADLAPTMAELLNVDFPTASGRPLEEVLEPDRAGAPRVILTIAWDGGGWNVLRTWPNRWPELMRMMERGSSVQDVIVGSSPSVTPSIHATMGTGAWPKQHGIVGIPLRDGDRITGAFRNKSPQYIDVPTLADTYDMSTANDAKIGEFAYKGWHIGMVGHGAYYDGADKDLAVIADTSERFVTNDRYYYVPKYLQGVPGLDAAIRRVDLADGEADSKWRGSDDLEKPSERRDTPAWVLYQTTLLKTLMQREDFGVDDVPDLFYTNYKQIDEIGHNYNMLAPEMGEIIEYTDDAMQALEAWLNGNVGEEQWVMIMTADHGQAPDPQAAHAWPIRMEPVQNDLADHFDMEVDELFQETSPAGYWLNRDALDAEGITLGQAADFLVDYRLEANIPAGEDLPAQYKNRLDEPIFAASFPGPATGRLWSCAKKRS